MELSEVLRASPGLLLAVVTLLGLCVGSFINVVVHRLPQMLEQGWRRDSREILGLPAEPEPLLTLAHPPSRCPACGTGIKPQHNLPVLGWLWLRGRCAACGTRISAEYPLVEAACGLLSALCVQQFGYSPELAAALMLTWALLALALIDFHTQLLPDVITLPLLWLGLALALLPVFADLQSAVIGAIAGYGLLWSVFWAFKLGTGREGMGYGDFKLLAALGAWLGWTKLPLILLLSSVSGALVGILLIVLRRQARGAPMPFGPFLAAAGWVALVFGADLGHAYRQAMGL